MALTIYFSGAISGGRGDVEQYREIVRALEERGHRVLAGMVTAANVSAAGESIAPAEIFARDLRWIGEADVLVAEVSVPSNGVGYEIAAARYRFGIPVVCLWRPAYSARCSAMIAGDAEIVLIEYDALADALPRLFDAVERVRNRGDAAGVTAACSTPA
jgi:hypothetical protein